MNSKKKHLCNSHLRVDIKGKRGGKLLFTEDMKKSTDILIKAREKSKVTQPYLFARLGLFTKPFKGTDCVRIFSEDAGSYRIQKLLYYFNKAEKAARYIGTNFELK